MLCFEGIAMALSIFQGKSKIPQYKLSNPSKLETLTISPEVAIVFTL
jgi:phenylalanyl-tRNA synthetase beta chain